VDSKEGGWGRQWFRREAKVTGQGVEDLPVLLVWMGPQWIAMGGRGKVFILQEYSCCNYDSHRVLIVERRGDWRGNQGSTGGQ